VILVISVALFFCCFIFIASIFHTPFFPSNLLLVRLSALMRPLTAHLVKSEIACVIIRALL
jgi:hypothetical protein